MKTTIVELQMGLTLDDRTNADSKPSATDGGRDLQD